MSNEDNAILILALESSEPRASLALMRSGILVDEAQSEPRRAHGGRLMVEIDTMLRNNAVSVDDVTVFASSAGPGSFTGIRVGLSTIRALAWAGGKTATAFGTLRVLAQSMTTEHGWVGSTIDARKGEVYGALYRRESGKCVEVVSPVAMEPTAWRSLAEEHADGSIHFVGSGVVTYEDVFSVTPHESSDCAPQASAVALLVHQQLANAGLEDLPVAIPSYVRPSEAEVKFGQAPTFDPTDEIRKTR